MNYTALYRKYRPLSFKEVYGQEHIVAALTNQIKMNRIAHAYLFCGTRGTGKTTMAKLFASAVNCLSDDNRPCGKCESCQDFLHGRSLNIIEIDAASNNGVDDVRGIIEEIMYSPANARYKVYIIDEVHMLSGSAFNALLKTLEEPPEYVIFILATTEPNKLPATILSRCQKYEFRQLASEIIYDRLSEIARLEGLDIEEAGLDYIARAGDGSMRDALSLLDRCVSYGVGQKITEAMIYDMLGAAEHRIFGSLISAVNCSDVAKVLEIIRNLSIRGMDYYRIAADLLWYLRNVMVLKIDSGLTDILNMSKDTAGEIAAVADRLSMQDVIGYIEELSGLYNRLKYSAVKRIDMEVALISMCSLKDSIKPTDKGINTDETGGMTRKADLTEVTEATAETTEVTAATNEAKAAANEAAADTTAEAVQEVPNAKAAELQNKFEEASVADTTMESTKAAAAEITEGSAPQPAAQTEEIDMQRLLDAASGFTRAMLKSVKMEVENSSSIVMYSSHQLSLDYFAKNEKKLELNQMLEKLGYMGYNIRACLVKSEPVAVDKEKLRANIKAKINNELLQWEE